MTNTHTSTMMKLLFSAAVIAAAGLTGCSSVLDVSPYDRIPREDAIIDASTAQAALNGAYAQLESSSLYGLDVQLLGDLPSDNASWGGTYQFLGDVTRNTIAADNPEVTSLWSALYREINRVNTVIVR